MPQKLDDIYYKKNAEFRNLLRILGTSIEGHRKVAFGLSQIRGVGRRLAQAVVRVAGIDPDIRIGLITEEQQQKLVDIIKEPWMVNRQKDIRTGEYRHISGTDLELLLKYDIDKMKRTRSWKGIRHMYGLKVRGQRTRTTGRRGLVVGYYRKDMKKKGAL
ncbi:MAG: 30S ribosomal protein S13 [Promethearchaeota archaeon]